MAMKKSTIKRRKRVVPALPDASDRSPRSHANSASPAPSPTQVSEGFAPSPRRLLGSPRVQSHQAHEEPRRVFEPPPVDFTGYGMSRPAPSEPQEMYREQQESPRLPYHTPRVIPPIQAQQEAADHRAGTLSQLEQSRKRSFSMAEGSRSSDTPLEPNHAARLSPDSTKTTNRLGSISSILNPTQTPDTGIADQPTSAESGPAHHHRASSASLPPAEHRRSSGGSGGSGGHPQLPPQSYSPYQHSFPTQWQSPWPMQPPVSAYKRAQSQPQEHSPRQSAMSVASKEHDESRKSRLRREMDELREALRRKERELDELA